ncbi:cellulose biosynthesis protein BcsQ [Novosphingobium chloroacetimidivorans]|uniref:Cellulose biosynthesis protein BcsQ n=1 Tax=Novosphingobium chloroacetimidivorans TaxID=1428314 RepID=A0A7W7K853_9SPHN|nr:cellulose synthase operon protein YhjQ/BcsQ [Novosphingobium chloroacetimidivorans]MBB4858032.1 cellulose biosynthesis protein BcsQ [Novosphingobium chloroacetimidivorans]
MALVLCHSLKGGVGATFLAAHLAMGLSQLEGSDGVASPRGSGDVALMTTSTSDLTPLHLGLPPAQRLPSMGSLAEASVLVNGINLYCEPNALADADFLPRLEDAGYLSAASNRTLVIDVPAGERMLARRLMAHATVHVCPLMASPDCLALLPQLLDEAGDWGAARTAYVIGKLDETRKLARHVAAFAREVLGDRLIGKIRNDQAVPEALAMLQLLSRYAPASAALADARLIADTVGMILAEERQAALASEEQAAAPISSGPAARPGASRAA